MTADHRLASRRVVKPNDLLDERVLIPGRNSPLRLGLDRAFSIEDHQPISTMETSMLNCCHFAAAGMGVASWIIPTCVLPVPKWWRYHSNRR
ncbi:LysR substrate-binding domain-containing protein [Rhizobium sp. NFACC06-2]|uniref:LysR substrate-binding domain-containing protein n=1 Tax=Rhizobium sp. NFACC06-2 TaxID=1566264 RepID=UPI0025704D56|nr:LysR substrate-binding domain-containing protein [Rhizobium sp. NFACC06-2]